MTKIEIQNLIKELIEQTNVSVQEIIVSEDAGDIAWFSVEVSHPHLFLDREGEALSALNHLVRRIVEGKMLKNKKEDEPLQHFSMLIDINGFQKKKIDSVRAIAHMMAERARYFKSSVEVDPMSAFDRRIVHEFLAGATDLKTESVGDGPSRRVVIKYLGGI